MRIVVPIGAQGQIRQELPQRPSSIEGLTIGLLDNNKPGATEILGGLGEALLEAGAREVLHRQKSHPAGPSPYIGELAERVHVAVSAVGD